jgi:hypothetical protein
MYMVVPGGWITVEENARSQGRNASGVGALFGARGGGFEEILLLVGSLLVRM